MRSIILIIFVSLVANIYSQVSPEWVQTFNSNFNGNDLPRAMTIDKDNNVIITGQTQVGATSQDYDYVTIKYNSAGGLLWSKTFNGAGNGADAAYSVTTDNTGNVYITGSSSGNGTDFDFLTIKYDSNGNLLWTKTYNYSSNLSDIAQFISVDSNSDIIVSGHSYSAQTGTDFTLIKYDTNGNELWIQRYTGSGVLNEYVKGMILDDLDNIYLTGNSGNTQVDFLTIKYNSNGSYQWDSRYNGISNLSDAPYSIAVDASRNVYVTGSVGISTTNLDFITIKYDTNGNSDWLRMYDGPAGGIDISQSIAVDPLKNVYVTGYSAGSGSAYDYATIKYDSLGNEQWVSRYNGSGNSFDQPYKVQVDIIGDIYITGESKGLGSESDFLTIKYDNQGTELWTSRYNGPGNSFDVASSLVLDATGNAYVSGYITGSAYDFATLKYSQVNSLRIIRPTLNDKFIAGTVDTIKWIGGSFGQDLQIEYSTDNGTNWFLVGYSQADVGKYNWDVPSDILTTKAKIKITDVNNPSESVVGYKFKIKPYILTTIDSNGDYYEYRKDRDQWGFWNNPNDMWPQTWWQQFNYQGIDPFLNLPYSQTQVNGTFAYSSAQGHIDWVSWVNTFGIDNCYSSTQSGIYNPAAVLKWRSWVKAWGGSCFGIAVANALAFGYKTEFLNKYSNFPAFITPISVNSTDSVRKVVNELFTHQAGNPHLSYRANVGLNKTPTTTLTELINMFKEDNSVVRTLSFNSNSNDPNNQGGHAIIAYGLEKDTLNPDIYYVKVYDNSFPNSNNKITINTIANGGSGSWVDPDWPGWGGSQWLYLRDPVVNYLFNPTLSKIDNQVSPFILDANELQIFSPKASSIKIIDQYGNVSGFDENTIKYDIPNSVPIIVDNGSIGPPSGYSLQTDNYSIVINDFAEDTVNTFFFTGNKSFMYERYGATQTQTDKINYDGGISVTNPDIDTKTFSLLGLVDENFFERLYNVNNIEMNQNDSIKIENFGNSNIKIKSVGSSKDYDIELNTVGEGLLVFKHNNIPLPGNTSHFIVPDWFSLDTKDLQIFEDVNNDGVIDDTLLLSNQTTGIGEDEGSLNTTNSYNLAQNYPNPFNPSTKISWQSPIGSHQTLKIYDVLGNEVATLVDEYREAGKYEIEFNAGNLSSGIYFYKLQAGSFSETKKMTLLR